MSGVWRLSRVRHHGAMHARARSSGVREQGIRRSNPEVSAARGGPGGQAAGAFLAHTSPPRAHARTHAPQDKSAIAMTSFALRRARRQSCMPRCRPCATSSRRTRPGCVGAATPPLCAWRARPQNAILSGEIHKRRAEMASEAGKCGCFLLARGPTESAARRGAAAAGNRSARRSAAFPRRRGATALINGAEELRLRQERDIHASQLSGIDGDRQVRARVQRCSRRRGAAWYRGIEEQRAQLDEKRRAHEAEVGRPHARSRRCVAPSTRPAAARRRRWRRSFCNIPSSWRSACKQRSSD
jgi:hypothetical protein